MPTLTDITQFVTFHSAAAQETATAQETAAAQPLSPSGVTTTLQTTTASAVQPDPLRRCTEAERGAYRIISITDTDATVRKHGDSIVLGYNGDVPHQPSTPG